MSEVSWGKRNLGVKAQRRVEALLQAPAQAAAHKLTVDCRVLWDRMEAHGISQNEAARRAGISISHLSMIMAGQRTPSDGVLRRLHDVLFAPSPSELVAPVELRVLGWKKDGHQGVVIQGAGGPRSSGKPGDGTIRVGGRVPEGAEVEYAYSAGYDSRGRVFVDHVVDERGYSVMLKQREADAV